ncbi:MAG: D-alanine--D-alanine ligase [Leptolyngbya sp. PLA3]|nr:MAG: D-alanine--D-alanine ligase [Cyanobacteria bacterium CYA]MCE7969931.1 D-alanine--D-alanine ligase [Leptolyngbya sp. PL-A3]
MKVLVLGGGPDAEREISLKSAAAVAAALRTRYEVVEQTIGRIGLGELRAMPGDVVFPALHGFFGEGGPMQDLLEADGRPYVGSGPGAARWCMDKIGTKLAALALGVPTAPACLFDPRDEKAPFDPPLVLKPTHDGSSVGLHMCADDEAWKRGRDAAQADVSANPYRSYMIERLVPGRELTVGLLGGPEGLRALPIIEIGPASGVYDYEAKYNRSDTRYTVGPCLPAGVGERVSEDALRLGSHLGVRDLARVDFLLDARGSAQVLEVNTMPGFTGTSLLPKAARAVGLSFEDLCAHLIELARARGR